MMIAVTAPLNSMDSWEEHLTPVCRCSQQARPCYSLLVANGTEDFFFPFIFHLPASHIIFFL